ncbi:hypothetical protein BaRGS_00010545 [Batillaria attramentaria]|uniref:Uncharacterized protein n=1 Tax=Batillaria attramentaria TaxID=370345 RepID=A0ABD0LFV8_9CAEN
MGAGRERGQRLSPRTRYSAAMMKFPDAGQISSHGTVVTTRVVTRQLSPVISLPYLPRSRRFAGCCGCTSRADPGVRCEGGSSEAA